MNAASMLPTDELVLEIGGARWRGWSDARVSVGIEAVAGSFALTLTAVESSASAALRPGLTPGAACTLHIEGQTKETVITGWVDEVAPAFDAGRHEVRVSGRDAAGDLVDCSAVHGASGAWSGATVATIAADLCRPFGVRVTTAAEVGAPFSAWKIQDGETVWACIERACRCRALLAVSDGLGGIVLTRSSAAARRPVTLARGPSVPLGARILSAEGTYGWSERFSQVTVKGQAPLHDDIVDDLVVAPKGVAKDAAINRYRPLIVTAEDLADGQTPATRALWEVNVRAARSRRVTVTLAGWRDSQGALWRPMTVVRVKDDWLGVDADMLVSGVEYAKSARGSTVRLSLLPPAAFDLLPAKEPAAKEKDDFGW